MIWRGARSAGQRAPGEKKDGWRARRVVVLEVANYIAGPYAGVLLADLGAEVIKVEDSRGGDPLRAWDLGGDQPSFWAFNRGKKSLTLNLRQPGATEVFYELARGADVVLENLRPGAMDR